MEIGNGSFDSHLLTDVPIGTGYAISLVAHSIKASSSLLVTFHLGMFLIVPWTYVARSLRYCSNILTCGKVITRKRTGMWDGRS